MYFSKENCFYLSTNIVSNVTEIKHLQLLWPLIYPKPQSNCILKMETTSILKKGHEWSLTLWSSLLSLMQNWILPLLFCD